VERISARPLTLDTIANAWAISRSHLAHAFGSATEPPAMQYLRARHLTDAARTLAAGAPGILSIALDAGYGSPRRVT